MAERRYGQTAPETTSAVNGEDWGRRNIEGVGFERVLFVDVDLTESLTNGASFTECAFRGVRFNASAHSDSAFMNCTFTRCDFFQCVFNSCKMVGSMFDGCSFDLMKVEKGDWSFTGLPGANLQGTRFSGVRLREADLTHARCACADFLDCDLSASWFHGADFADANLIGSNLTGLDPLTTALNRASVDQTQAVVLVEALGLQVIGL
ncbi:MULTISPECIES: pentapeptide repeat-containing protein [Mycolicibacterium]|uniref:pentapeptide repeat-containing protein n=1 Tax=Mycolicibacterium TaxID=1866885 RepID=UPI0014907C36|nr:pentapeptide repeat-containing protein [Mycolicibacterium fortuitum]